MINTEETLPEPAQKVQEKVQAKVEEIKNVQPKVEEIKKSPFAPSVKVWGFQKGKLTVQEVGNKTEKVVPKTQIVKVVKKEPMEPGNSNIQENT